MPVPLSGTRCRFSLGAAVSDVEAMRARLASIEAEESEILDRHLALARARNQILLDIAAAEGRPHGQRERFAVAFLAGDQEAMRAINTEMRGER